MVQSLGGMATKVTNDNIPWWLKLPKSRSHQEVVPVLLCLHHQVLKCQMVNMQITAILATALDNFAE